MWSWMSQLWKEQIWDVSDWKGESKWDYIGGKRLHSPQREPGGKIYSISAQLIKMSESQTKAGKLKNSKFQNFKI